MKEKEYPVMEFEDVQALVQVMTVVFPDGDSVVHITAAYGVVM